MHYCSFFIPSVSAWTWEENPNKTLIFTEALSNNEKENIDDILASFYSRINSQYSDNSKKAEIYKKINQRIWGKIYSPKIITNRESSILHYLENILNMELFHLGQLDKALKKTDLWNFEIWYPWAIWIDLNATEINEEDMSTSLSDCSKEIDNFWNYVDIECIMQSQELFTLLKKSFDSKEDFVTPYLRQSTQCVNGSNEFDTYKYNEWVLHWELLEIVCDSANWKTIYLMSWETILKIWISVFRSEVHFNKYYLNQKIQDVSNFYIDIKKINELK